jgi:hypothetical protein
MISRLSTIHPSIHLLSLALSPSPSTLHKAPYTVYTHHVSITRYPFIEVSCRFQYQRKDLTDTRATQLSHVYRQCIAKLTDHHEHLKADEYHESESVPRVRLGVSATRSSPSFPPRPILTLQQRFGKRWPRGSTTLSPALLSRNASP